MILALPIVTAFGVVSTAWVSSSSETLSVPLVLEEPPVVLVVLAIPPPAAVAVVVRRGGVGGVTPRAAAAAPPAPPPPPCPRPRNTCPMTRETTAPEKEFDAGVARFRDITLG